MDVTLLATGSPVATVERGGTSVLVTVGGEPVLVDCGPRTVLRLVEHGVDLADVETLLFTHHHVDHNADFFEFVIGSWSAGREALTVYGPEGTGDYVDALYDLYDEDIAYRQWFGHPADGIEDVEVVRTTGDLVVETDAWSATALPVEHSIETYAYRFEDVETGQSCVVSGDTRRIDALADFAAGADVLIQDACIAPRETDDGPRPMSQAVVAKHEQNHCSPEDAGRIAADAGVGTLVLTHLLPDRDYDAMRASARSVFDGEVVVAEDGTTLSP